ncbi:DUF7109 family protein [Halorubrum cibi]|uniref:Uncharacterized protein n=1 Tax=Halorubrum cibi TaxID=413815 RepID=A0A521BTW1_9EURY|nr:hypothetical protein [Halorubrum cibi]SMO50588.1 hypothetical protein SAMN06264867_10353 [Halorubrum cibi]
MSEGSGPSVAARDDLAGVVDLFEWLTREELSRAVSELAFKRRAEVDPDAIDAAIDAAVAEYALVRVPPEAVSTDEGAPEEAADPLAVGPAAFPSLPENAADLPHILDVPDRAVDRGTLSEAVHDRLSADAVSAMNEGDADRLETLVDVTYDVEAWTPVDASPIRERIVAELDGE